jgi:hypothetical protein
MRVHAIRLAVLLFLAPATLLSQNQTSALDFSGVLFGNYQWRTDSAAKFATGGKPANRFDIGRAYLNFRMPAGDRGAIRITTDVYQQTGAAAAFYAGWAIRLKYGFFQYEFTKNLAGVEGLTALGRLGMLQTVVIEHMETFWPRWMGNTAVETHGFFSSADVGVSGLFSLPNRWGEVYTTIVNGNGYTAAETDRFKDIGARVSITPFASDSGFFRTFTITPWYSKGSFGSTFADPNPVEVGTVSEGVQRDRVGIFAGLRDRRLTGGVEYAERLDEVETGANTVLNPRGVTKFARSLVSGFAFVRPLEIADPSKRSRLSVFGRFDSFEDANLVDAKNELTWFGVLWDLNQRATFSLDYQELKPKHPDATPPFNPTIPTKTLFAHWVVTF